MSELHAVVSMFVALIFCGGVFIRYRDLKKNDGLAFGFSAKITSLFLFLLSIGSILTGNFDLINNSLINVSDARYFYISMVIVLIFPFLIGLVKSFESPMRIYSARQMGFYNFDIEDYSKMVILCSLAMAIISSVLFDVQSNCSTTLCFKDTINSSKFRLFILSLVWVLFLTSLGVLHAFMAPIILAWVIASTISSAFGIKLIVDNYSIFYVLNLIGIKTNFTQILIAITSVLFASGEIVWAKIQSSIE